MRRSHTARDATVKARIVSAFPRHPSLAAFLDQGPLKAVAGGNAPSRVSRWPALGEKRNSKSGKLNALGEKQISKSDKLVFLGEKRLNKSEKLTSLAEAASVKRSKLVLYPYQSVEVKNKSDASAGSISGQFTASAEEPMHGHNVSHQVSSAGCSLAVIDSRPLHKCRSEVIAKVSCSLDTSAGSHRTPLKQSKTDVNLTSCVTPVFGNLSLLPGTPCSNGGVTGTPNGLTPRTGRGSKRARRRARNARLALLGDAPTGASCEMVINVDVIINY